MSLRARLRALGRSRALCAAVVATLALGVGAVVTVFGIVDAAMLRPPPFRDAERLTMLFLERTTPGEGPRRERWSFPRVRALRRAATSFERIAHYSPVSLAVADAADPEPVRGEYAPPDYFALLGVSPLLGRVYDVAEDGGADGTGAPTPVVVLGHALWTRRYGADPKIVGRVVRVSSVPLTVVGVMPRGFRGLSDRAELWVPTAMAPRLTYRDYLTTDQGFISAVGRLKPGVSLAAADAELRVLGARVDAAWPGDDRVPGERVAGVVVPLNEARLDVRARRALLVLAAAVAALHLLACANATSLLLGRAAARRREAAVRLALGGAPGRLFRDALAEGSALAVAGGVVGLALAALATRVVAVPTEMWGRNFYGSLGLFDTPSPGVRTLVFAAALVAATALLVAWAPAASALRTDVGPHLRDGARGASRDAVTLRRFSARGAIVAVEAALATLLLVAAGLLVDSYARMRGTALGIDASHVMSFLVMPSERRIPQGDAPAFVARLLDAVARVPGVVSASVDGGAPVSGSARSVLHVLGRAPVPDAQAPPVLRHYVGPDHFRTLGVPLLRGRAFDAGDIAGRPRVAVISATAARRFWPDADPIGQRVWFGGGSSFDRPDSSAEIVGIVGDVVYEPLDANPNRASFYTPYAQFTYAWRMVLVRTEGDPTALTGALRRAVASVDPDLPIMEPMPLGERIGDSWARHRFDAALFGAFGAAALLLAASGIYAVVAHAVAQRTRELGVRLALGARRRDVVRLVVGEGMALPAVGLLAGVVAALALTRLLRASLYEVAPTEPRVFAAGVATLLAAALAACLVPARRATRVDPLEALRAE